MKGKQTHEQLTLPWGARFVEALIHHPLEEVRAMATSKEAEVILQSVREVIENPVEKGFLHSALCAMSLPVRRPKNEMEPIVRNDGNYTLIIRPIEQTFFENGQWVHRKLGVPYGVYARLIILFIMSEAVKRRSKEIFLGESFSAWLRRMGISNTQSGGVRGTRSLVQEQINRLLACQWTIRWEANINELSAISGRNKSLKGIQNIAVEDSMLTAFNVANVSIADNYGGIRTKSKEFRSQFVLSDSFYQSLIDHAVPINERAFAVLKRSATQMDLYTYLSYRLPRIPQGKTVYLSWDDLRRHLGNHTDDGQIYKFRQTVRRSWQEVSGVYHQARFAVDFDDLVIKLSYAPPPVDGHLIKLSSATPKRVVSAKPKVAISGEAEKSSQLSLLPSGRIQWPADNDIRDGCPELLNIAKEYGNGWDVDLIARDFRKLVGPEIYSLEGDYLLKRFKRFCEVYSPGRERSRDK